MLNAKFFDCDHFAFRILHSILPQSRGLGNPFQSQKKLDSGGNFWYNIILLLKKGGEIP